MSGLLYSTVWKHISVESLTFEASCDLNHPHFMWWSTAYQPLFKYAASYCWPSLSTLKWLALKHDRQGCLIWFFFCTVIRGGMACSLCNYGTQQVIWSAISLHPMIPNLSYSCTSMDSMPNASFERSRNITMSIVYWRIHLCGFFTLDSFTYSRISSNRSL